MKKVIKISVGVLIGIIFIGTIVFLYQKSKAKPVVFETKSPSKTNIIKKTVATGSVVPRREIEIVPQVSGIIAEIYVKAGKPIKKGDPIAKVKIIPNMLQLNEAESRVEKAKINYNDIKSLYERQKRLYDEKVISASEFQKDQASLETTMAETRAAENNLALVKEGVTKDSKNTTNTIVRSTIDGMILDVPVKEGNSVIESNPYNPGTKIAIIADMGEMIFQGKIDEAEVGKLKQGMPLTLSIGAIENVKFKANLEYISPKGLSENGAIQFEIKAGVKLIDTVFIRAGYSANAEVILDRRDSVLAIEENLLQMRNDSTFVEIEKKPQVFEKKLVKTGISDGINIEILSGLNKTDKIKVPK